MSSLGDVPEMAAAFPLWTAKPSLCLRKGRARESPEIKANLEPISLQSSLAAGPHVPRDSMAIGTNKMSPDCSNREYLVRLSCSALAAAEPAEAAKLAG